MLVAQRVLCGTQGARVGFRHKRPQRPSKPHISIPQGCMSPSHSTHTGTHHKQLLRRHSFMLTKGEWHHHPQFTRQTTCQVGKLLAQLHPSVVQASLDACRPPRVRSHSPSRAPPSPRPSSHIILADQSVIPHHAAARVTPSAATPKRRQHHKCLIFLTWLHKTVNMAWPVDQSVKTKSQGRIKRGSRLEATTCGTNTRCQCCHHHTSLPRLQHPPHRTWRPPQRPCLPPSPPSSPAPTIVLYRCLHMHAAKQCCLAVILLYNWLHFV